MLLGLQLVDFAIDNLLPVIDNLLPVIDNILLVIDDLLPVIDNMNMCRVSFSKAKAITLAVN